MIYYIVVLLLKKMRSKKKNILQKNLCNNIENFGKRK